MSELDDAFHEAIATVVDPDAAEQMENAARTVAASRPAPASVTSIRSVPAGDVPALRALALDLAHRYGVTVTFEERVSIAVRFSQ